MGVRRIYGFRRVYGLPEIHGNLRPPPTRRLLLLWLLLLLTLGHLPSSAHRLFFQAAPFRPSSQPPPPPPPFPPSSHYPCCSERACCIRWLGPRFPHGCSLLGCRSAAKTLNPKPSRNEHDASRRSGWTVKLSRCRLPGNRSVMQSEPQKTFPHSVPISKPVSHASSCQSCLAPILKTRH
jgi:hypothetical protein